MAFHRIASCVFLLALIAGSLSAITNVTSVSQTNLARWSQPTAPSSVATQGGNITNANITGASQLTTKWADIYGSITVANIILTSSGLTNNVYTWNATAATKGDVCVSTASTFPGPTLSSANVTDINTVWSLTTIDNATNTYNITLSNFNISGSVISSVNASDLQGLSSFFDAAIFNGTTGSKGNYAFCTSINSTGKNYNNVTANYELLVPTTPGGTDTYNFYMEIQG